MYKTRIPVTYRCNNYIIANKPYNVLSQPGLESHLKHQPGTRRPPVIIDALKEQQGRYNPFVSEWRTVHRLDRYVTGGMLIAENKNAAIQFSRNLKKGGNSGFKFTRRYVALVEDPKPGKIIEPEGEICSEGMVSNYRKFDENCFLFELITGDKHQIRRHLAKYIGQPVLNDTKYGGNLVKGIVSNQLALHSACIKTKIGSQYREHLIPMVFKNNGFLWSSKYLDKNGYFIPEINKLLLEDWDF